MNFPPNLYENRGYFTWRNPITKDEFGVSSNRQYAFSVAHQCNAKIAKQLGIDDIVERATGGGKQTVTAWETKYQGILGKHPLTKETRANYLAFSRRVVRMLGPKVIRSVTAKDVADGLEAISDEGLPGVAKAVRAYMRLSFEEAVNQGWLDVNPVRITRIVGDTSVKRARLTLDVFLRVYETAPTEWLRNAMDLALVSAQRREDVANAKFKDFHDGGWWLEQASEKTDHPHRIFIPSELRCNDYGKSVGDVLSQCRRGRPFSHYLIHQTVQRGASRVGNRIGLATITGAFTDAVEALGLDFGTKTPPTFHEIRSLSLRLYGAQGVNAQLLAGHSDPDTTAIYLNNRGQDYARVTV